MIILVKYLKILFLFTFLLLSDSRIKRDIFKPANSFKYNVVFPSFTMTNLCMIGQVNEFGVYGKNEKEKLYGKILRSLRYYNITRAVEKKYDLPENFILAMVMHETGGVDMLPNALNDGGIGLCHMQGLLAHQFGLKTYKSCDKIVCRKHGRELRNLIVEHKYNRARLIKYDDRFHPVMNLDAAGRMISHFSKYKNSKIKNKWKKAIRYYAGSKNYPYYWGEINKYMSSLEDTILIKDIEKVFNSRNSDFRINGEKADFQAYLNAFLRDNFNYELARYLGDKDNAIKDFNEILK